MKFIPAKLILALAIGTIVSLITAQKGLASFEAPVFYDEEEASYPYMSPEEILNICRNYTARSNKGVTEYYESRSKPNKYYSPWSDFDCVELAYSSPGKVQKVLSHQRAWVNCVENDEISLPPEQRARFCKRR